MEFNILPAPVWAENSLGTTAQKSEIEMLPRRQSVNTIFFKARMFS